MGLYEITDIKIHFKFYDYIYRYLGMYLQRDSDTYLEYDVIKSLHLIDICVISLAKLCPCQSTRETIQQTFNCQ